jgi:hypothetical protein
LHEIFSVRDEEWQEGLFYFGLETLFFHTIEERNNTEKKKAEPN